MEKKMVSNLSNLPKSYIIPPEKRPGNNSYPICNIPVIDLSKAKVVDRPKIIDQIMQASKKFGFFQVINHGVAIEVMEDAMKVFKEFFELPFEKKSHLYNTNDENVKCKLYTSSYNYENEEIHFWRDCLIHDCAPLKESFDLWPRNPPRYREVVWEYLAQVRELGSRILDLISEGLGFESDFFAHDYNEDFFFTVNHYPPCPDPSLTLGLPKHCDPNVITLLLQDIVPGLQVCVDNEWQLIQPCPNAFVVNMGHQMQVISNGKLKGAEHRVVTNTKKSRTTASYFVVPSKDCILEPAKALTEKDPPLYKQFRYAEFMETYKALSTQEPENLLEHYKINYKGGDLDRIIEDFRKLTKQ